jgi:hypothetical protein
MKDFLTWCEVQGYRGIGNSEMRAMAQAQQTGQGYRSPTMKSGDVYFDTGPQAQQTAMNYVFQGGGGDAKLGANTNSAGRGYVLNMNVPDDQAHQPDFATDTGHTGSTPDSYRAVKQMTPNYAPTYQRVMPNPQGPMKFGDMTIARPPVVGKEKQLEPLLQRYNRFANYMQSKQNPSGSP